jgi:hypothetical protein
LLIGAVALLHLHIRLRWSDEVFIPALAGFFALYWMVMSAVVMRYQARSFALRDADRPPPSLANGSIAIASGLAIGVGTAVGALAWMIQLARVAGDGLGALTVVVLIAVVSTVNIFALRRAPRLMLPVATVAICAAIVVMVNWRLNTWIAAQRGTTPVQTDLPLWSINLAAAIMVLWVGACWMLYARATRVPMESRP